MITSIKEWIEAAFDGFFESQTEDRRYVTSDSTKMFAEHIATLAMSAGREQGLREAKEVCERRRDYEFSQNRGSAAMSAGDCAAAIEQLRK